MSSTKQVMGLIGLVAIAAAWLAVAGLGSAMAIPRHAGVGVTVDWNWIAIDCYFSARDRATDVRERGLPDGPSSRAENEARTVRIGRVPNLAGRAHHNFVVVRALCRTAMTVAQHWRDAQRGDESLAEPAAGDQ